MSAETVRCYMRTATDAQTLKMDAPLTFAARVAGGGSWGSCAASPSGRRSESGKVLLQHHAAIGLRRQPYFDALPGRAGECACDDVSFSRRSSDGETRPGRTATARSSTSAGTGVAAVLWARPRIGR